MYNQLYPTILYCFCFVTLFYILYRRKTGLLSLYIVLIWIFSSLFAALFQFALPDNYIRISFLPYLYLFICFLLSLIPLIRVNKNISCIELSEEKIRLYKNIMIVFIIISILPTIENFRFFLSSYTGADTSGLAEMYDDKMYGDGIVTSWLSTPSRIFNSIDGIFIHFLIFSSFFFLTVKNVSKFFVCFSFLPIGNHLLFQLCVSGRGTITMFLMVSIFFLIVFFPYIPKRRKKYIKMYGIAIISFFVFSLGILTLSRKAATNNGVAETIVVGYYVAKGHLDFNENMWYIKKHTEGDNSFPFFKTILGLDVPVDKNVYWNESKIGIAPNLFYTYIGDWYMDLGETLTIILIIILSIILTRYFSFKKHSGLLKMFFFYVYSLVLIMGWSMYYYKPYGTMKNLLFSIILITIIQNYKTNRCTK